MYHFVKDKEFLKRAQESCVKDLQELVDLLLKEGISTQFILVGSGARKMVTQNENGSIDFDYNLLIQKCNDINDCRYLKETTRKALNKIMKKNGLCDVEDSTSALSSKCVYFKDKPNIKFSMDLCIITQDNKGNWQRLIHEKTGFTNSDKYFWNQVPNSSELSQKAITLKENNLWEEVRQCYLNKKNLYLKRNDNNHPSFVCYIEAVNEVYNRYKQTKKS